MVNTSRINRGIYKDGGIVASAVIENDGGARLMIKGLEPLLPGDPAFTERLKKIVSECRGHLEGAKRVEIHVVLTRAAGLAEQVNLKPDDLATMGVRRVILLDGESGLTVRVFDEDPLPTLLSYESLRADLSGVIPDQPGLVDVPPRYTRKLHRDLTEEEKKVFEMAVQRAGRGLMKLVIVEDGDLKLAVTLKDMPPARARSVILPLSELGKEVAGGMSIEQLANKLEVVRAG